MPAPHNPDAPIGSCPCEGCLELIRFLRAIPPRQFYCANIQIAREEYRRIFQTEHRYEERDRQAQKRLDEQKAEIDRLRTALSDAGIDLPEPEDDTQCDPERC
jgi:hypothetical protein